MKIISYSSIEQRVRFILAFIISRFLATSGKRKRIDDEKVEEDSTREYSNVVCKWARVCNIDTLDSEIQRSCFVLKQVQLEAWHVANLHLHRCFKDNIALPKLDTTFFYRCCFGMLERENGHDPRACKDSTLNETLIVYRRERQLVAGYTAPRLDYAGASLLELGAQMCVNAQNMIVLQFEKRLRQYVRFRYETSYADTNRLVKSCYRKQGTFTPEATELRGWLGMLPYEIQLKRNLIQVLTKLHDMQVWMEEFVKKKPNTKGTRVYSLLPHTNTFAAAHITINGSTLHGICARIFQEKGMNVLQVPLAKREGLMDVQYFQQNRDLLLRTAFDVSQFETANRKFGHQITTNGYSVSVLLVRPKTALELKREEMNMEGVKFNENNPPADYRPDMVIGIDPGMRSLCTAVSEGSIRNPPRSRRERAKKDRRKAGKQRKKEGRVIHEISTKEYRHFAGMNKACYWNEGLKTRYLGYAEIIHSIPSYKIATLTGYLADLGYFWKNVSIMTFCATEGFLKWRFFQARVEQKILDTLVKRLEPVASPNVLIGYGDWSCRDGISGHAPNPVKGFKEALKKRATVVPIDEYRTSKLCSTCHSPLAQALLLAKTKDKEVVLKKTRNVLHCASSDCKATFWNRDVNAGHNILSLLHCKLRGVRRLEAFSRK